jgi:purine-cytosine permease-like protein
LGLSLGWTIIAGTLGILVGTLFMAFHATQGPRLGLPQILTLGVIFGLAGGHAPSQHLGFVFSAFMAQFSAAAAYNITYAPYVSDY